MWAVLRGQQLAGRLAVASPMVSRHVLDGALPVTGAASLSHLDCCTGPVSSWATSPRPAPLISPRYSCAVCLFVLFVFRSLIFEHIILIDHDHALT